MKLSRITRILKILTTLQAEKNYSANKLAKMFGTSRRTIFRDLNELQAIGVPYHYDHATSSYSVDPEFFLPPIDLNLQEALSLLLLVGKAKDHIQSPFKGSTLMAAMKIKNNLPAKIKRDCDIALRNISIQAAAQAPMEHLDKIFAQLQNAIVNKREMSMCYHSLFEGRVINVNLCPYHLLYNHRAWYVLGFVDLHNSIRTFKLNRIKDLKTLDKCFTENENFNVYDYLGNAWSMIPEGRIYDIKLRFLPKVAENVTEVQWHRTQKVTRNADGSAIAEFRVDGLEEISWWILGYGDQVQVLAPKALREKIVKTAKNMIKLNEQI